MNNGKIRIYELSKELNLDNKDIKDICEQLNIAVKSHSSTITDNQAERVRAIAEKYPSSNKKTTLDQGKKQKTIKGKRKQQILAIHHKSNSVNSTASVAAAGPTATPKLASPPTLPSQSKSSSSISPSVQSPVSPKAQLQAPPKVSDSQAQSSVLETPAVEKTTTQSKTLEPKETSKPQIIEPPTRPQLVKPVSRASTEQEQPNSQKKFQNKDSEKTLTKKISAKVNKSTAEKTTATKNKTKQAPQSNQLQRPTKKNNFRTRANLRVY